MLADLAERGVFFCDFDKLLIDVSIGGDPKDHVQDMFVEGVRFDEGFPQDSA